MDNIKFSKGGIMIQTDKSKLLDKITCEIDTAKGWEEHISGHNNNQEKEYTALDMEQQYWLGGKSRLQDLKTWIEREI